MVETTQTADELRKLFDDVINREDDETAQLSVEKRELLKSFMGLIRDTTCHIREKTQITPNDSEEIKERKRDILTNYQLGLYDIMFKHMFPSSLRITSIEIPSSNVLTSWCVLL